MRHNPRRRVARRQLQEESSSEDVAKASEVVSGSAFATHSEEKKPGTTSFATSSSSSFSASDSKSMGKKKAKPEAGAPDSWNLSEAKAFVWNGTRDGNAISFLSGEECTVPKGWGSKEGGDKAAAFANFAASKFNEIGYAKSYLLKAKKSFMFWCCFRFAGSRTLRVKLRDGKKDTWKVRLRFKPLKGAKTKDDIWDRKTGEPLLWKNPVCLEKVCEYIFQRKIGLSLVSYADLESEDDESDSDMGEVADGAGEDRKDQKQSELKELRQWMEAVTTFQNPGASEWKAPFLCYKSQIVYETTSFLDVRFDVYLNRMIFFLIADKGLKILFRNFEKSTVIRHEVTLQDTVEPCFTQSMDPASIRASRFRIDTLLRSQESIGYKPYPQQPPGIKLELRDYQLQTLQWMIDQETSERGLNGYLWEKRGWIAEESKPNPDGTSEKQQKQKKRKTENAEERNGESFFFSAEIGELRTEKPPLVRGGLVCEEMGLGKTLEFLSLIMHFHGRSEPDFSQIKGADDTNLQFSKASMFVVPDVLIPQWESEILKTLARPQDLRVATAMLISEKGGRHLHVSFLDQPVEEVHKLKISKTSKTGRDQRAVALEMISQTDILITNYATVRTCDLFQSIFWRRVCLDEMQEVRSSTTTLARMCQKLCARARWMISGTPIYTGINDLNGELNFLGVIPFALSDKEDGFWGLRVKQPFDERKDSALHNLKLLLDCVMMRHSKKQLHVANPQMNILRLPIAKRRFVGVSLDKPEQACHDYLEVRAAHGAQLERSSNPGSRFSSLRPGAVGSELLRRFCISPSLLSGGNGAPSRIRDVNEFVRSVIRLVRMHSFGKSATAFETSLDMGDGFRAMPCDLLRDHFLSAKSGSSSVSNNKIRNYAQHKGGGVGAAGAAAHETTMQRLEEAEEKLKAAKRVLEKGKASRDGGILPKLRWKWAMQAVTSGKYLCLTMLRSQWHQASAFYQRCPLLWARAVKMLVLTQRLGKATAHIEELRSKFEVMDGEELCEILSDITPAKFSFEIQQQVDDDLFAMLSLAQTELVMRFSGEEEITFQSNPVANKRKLINAIIGEDPSFHVAKFLVDVAEKEFNDSCAEGIIGIQGLPLFVFNLNFRFEARFVADSGKQAFVPVKVHPEEVDVKAGTIKVTFLDDEKATIPQHLVRLESAPRRNEIFSRRSFDELFVSCCRRWNLPGEVLERLSKDPRTANLKICEIDSIPESDLRELVGEDQRYARMAKNMYQHIIDVFVKQMLRVRSDLAPRVREWYLANPAKPLKPLFAMIHAQESHANVCASAFAYMGLKTSSDVSYSDFSLEMHLKGLPRGMSSSAVPVSSSSSSTRLPLAKKRKGEDETLHAGAPVDEEEEGVRFVLNIAGDEVPVRRVVSSDLKREVVVVLRADSNELEEFSWNVFLGDKEEATKRDKPKQGKQKKGNQKRNRNASYPRKGRKRNRDDDETEAEKPLDFDFPEVRMGRNKHSPVQALMTNIDQVKREIEVSKGVAGDLTCYTATLRLAIKRGSSNPDVIEKQGFQALQQFIDKSGTPKCAICLDYTSDPVCTSCIHIFCGECLTQHIDAMAHINFSFSSSRFTCPLCRSKLHREDVTRILPPSETSLDTGKQSSSSSSSSKSDSQCSIVVEASTMAEAASFSRHADGQQVQENLKDQVNATGASALETSVFGLEALSTDFVKLLQKISGVGVGASHSVQAPAARGSKMKRIVSDIREFTKEGKVVCFSQFREAVQHLHTVLEQERIPAVRIIKSERQGVLQNAIKAFTQDEKVRVLCLQSSSAAAGLTLTVANRVLLIDPFIKPGEEEQAINRVHRIGQVKEVEAVCYFSRNTIEERLLAWRAKKDGSDDIHVIEDEGRREEIERKSYLRFILGISADDDDDADDDDGDCNTDDSSNSEEDAIILVDESDSSESSSE